MGEVELPAAGGHDTPRQRYALQQVKAGGYRVLAVGGRYRKAFLVGCADKTGREA